MSNLFSNILHNGYDPYSWNPHPALPPSSAKLTNKSKNKPLTSGNHQTHFSLNLHNLINMA